MEEETDDTKGTKSQANSYRYMIGINIPGFFGKLTTGKWAKIAKCSTDTALNDIRDLVEKGILKKTEEGGRSTNYILLE